MSERDTPGQKFSIEPLSEDDRNLSLYVFFVTIFDCWCWTYLREGLTERFLPSCRDFGAVARGGGPGMDSATQVSVAAVSWLVCALEFLTWVVRVAREKQGAHDSLDPLEP